MNENTPPLLPPTPSSVSSFAWDVRCFTIHFHLLWHIFVVVVGIDSDGGRCQPIQITVATYAAAVVICYCHCCWFKLILHPIFFTDLSVNIIIISSSFLLHVRAFANVLSIERQYSSALFLLLLDSFMKRTINRNSILLSHS